MLMQRRKKQRHAQGAEEPPVIPEWKELFKLDAEALAELADAYGVEHEGRKRTTVLSELNTIRKEQ